MPVNPPNNPEEIPEETSEPENGTGDTNGGGTEEPEKTSEPEDTGEMRDPTPAEKTFFDELLEQLKEDKERWPENGSIEEKVGSMITPFEFKRSCQGIEGTTVSKAKITVTSKQIHFDGELARTVNPDATTGPPQGVDIMQCKV